MEAPPEPPLYDHDPSGPYGHGPYGARPATLEERRAARAREKALVMARLTSSSVRLPGRWQAAALERLASRDSLPQGERELQVENLRTQLRKHADRSDDALRADIQASWARANPVEAELMRLREEVEALRKRARAEHAAGRFEDACNTLSRAQTVDPDALSQLAEELDDARVAAQAAAEAQALAAAVAAQQRAAEREAARKRAVTGAVGEWCRVLKQAKLRVGYDTASKACGMARQGELIRVLESQTNEYGHGRRVKSKFSSGALPVEGWMSVKAADGTILLERVSAEGSSASPCSTQ